MLVERGVRLAPLTTLGIGGVAKLLVDVTDSAEFRDVVALVRDVGIAPVCLGHGSNVLVNDGGCPNPVLRLSNQGVTFRNHSDPDLVVLVVEAGHPLQDLVDLTIAEGLTGLEMMIGIPGTVGAAPIQNVGAYGQEIADVLVGVDVWDWVQRRELRLTRADCGFGHRTSRFKRSRRWTLLRVELVLRRSVLSAPVRYRQVAEELDVPLGTQVALDEAAVAVRAVRSRKGMILDPTSPDNRSVGSVFLSPAVDREAADRLRRQGAPVHDFSDGSTRVSASWLIKEAGLRRGQRLATGVRISRQHYTLVAEDGASAANFALATRDVVRRVRAATGVVLTPEIDPLPEPEPEWPG
ncbi:UDP-N-acetylenolpyruvoylglucosamine reductase [Longimycelium tulufanense]|uniref:UDP-N-acetylenolpyruvoylglucosamine reductase n=1 Tax=Longimycelium tulufanense TaxID=907463 RepID=A0A8J3FZD1_9PSEU|nr:UDP-N-acetylmuramate dehydrogenase [Longimycelium tulufanense]GGM79233.1 UDP-N-acetylenolpyruvoylglucosamine reductase [Longimycelium tulufanense]